MKKMFINEDRLTSILANKIRRRLNEDLEDDDELEDNMEDENEDDYEDEDARYNDMTASEKFYYYTDELGYDESEIPDDEYIRMLEQRRDECAKWNHWVIPDLVWDDYMEILDDCGVGEKKDPAIVVDNIAVNGEYGEFDEFKDPDESDEDFIAREEDRCARIFPEERFIIYQY